MFKTKKQENQRPLNSPRYLLLFGLCCSFMEGFYITISNGLLKNGHRKRMGASVWEFMWLLDKITKIDDQELGWVLGGKPIKLREMADDLEVSEITISENLGKLEEAGYIKKITAPYGLSIKVIKAKKRFKQMAKPLSKEVYANGETSFGKGETYFKEKLKPNKTIQLDNTIDNNLKVTEQSSEFGNPDINYLINLLKETNNNLLDGSIKENRRSCQILLNKLGYANDPAKARNGVEVVIKTAAQSDFHSKNATSFKYLLAHTSKIIQEYKGRKNKVHIMKYE